MNGFVSLTSSSRLAQDAFPSSPAQLPTTLAKPLLKLPKSPHVTEWTTFSAPRLTTTSRHRKASTSISRQSPKQLKSPSFFITFPDELRPILNRQHWCGFRQSRISSE